MRRSVVRHKHTGSLKWDTRPTADHIGHAAHQENDLRFLNFE